LKRVAHSEACRSRRTTQRSKEALPRDMPMPRRYTCLLDMRLTQRRRPQEVIFLPIADRGFRSPPSTFWTLLCRTEIAASSRTPARISRNCFAFLEIAAARV
jgi:hypothetical protein